MKAKYLFLLKLLGYSLILFIAGRPLLNGYASMMQFGSNLTDPFYRMPQNIENFLYGSSMIIIAFLALTISTPKVPVKKKAGIIFIGLIAFFLTDLLFVQYAIFPQGQPVSNENYPVFEMYLCIKWLLPFLLWIIMSYPYIEKLFNLENVSRT